MSSAKWHPFCLSLNVLTVAVSWWERFWTEQESAGERRNFKPMTKEEWEKQQSVVRRVYDPETGRNR